MNGTTEAHAMDTMSRAHAAARRGSKAAIAMQHAEVLLHRSLVANDPDRAIDLASAASQELARARSTTRSKMLQHLTVRADEAITIYRNELIGRKNR